MAQHSLSREGLGFRRVVETVVQYYPCNLRNRSATIDLSSRGSSKAVQVTQSTGRTQTIGRFRTLIRLRIRFGFHNKTDAREVLSQPNWGHNELIIDGYTILLI